MKQMGRITNLISNVFLHALGLAIGLAIKLIGKPYNEEEAQAEKDQKTWEEISRDE